MATEQVRVQSAGGSRDGGTTNRGLAGHLLVIVGPAVVDATFLRWLLADTGAPMDARWASSPSEAVHAVQDSNIAAVLLALGSPDGGGLELLELVLRAQPAMPVVVLTGPDDDGFGQRAVSAGAQDYLVTGKSPETFCCGPCGTPSTERTPHMPGRASPPSSNRPTTPCSAGRSTV